jgi:TIR domain
MSDIFISHSSADRPRVSALVDALRGQGWSIWWSPTILPGEIWNRKIEKELVEAKCVIVLWSKNSIQSDWVGTEAEEAKKRKILVPALIDDVAIPLAFRSIQTANLIDWRGQEAHAGFDQLVRGISGVLSGPAHEVRPTPPAGQRLRRGALALALSVLALAGIVGLAVTLGAHKAPTTHVAGDVRSAAPLPGGLRIIVTNSAGSVQSAVDNRGHFDVPVTGSVGDNVKVQVYSGDQLLYDHYQTLGGWGPLLEIPIDP